MTDLVVSEEGELVPPRQGTSIVVPAYDEEQGIGDVLAEIIAALEGHEPAVRYEIIVVDDGSRDGTAAAVEPFLGGAVRLLRHERNRGYGAAIKTGLRAARHPWILIIDADGTYPSERIVELIDRGADHDMVVGARTSQGAGVPLLRRPARWVLRKLAEYLCQARIPDLNSGLRIIRRDLLETYRPLLPDGFSLTTTITLALLSAGYRVDYLPIDYRKRTGSSKLRPVGDTMAFVVLIFRTIAYFEPLRVFVPAAALFVVASVALGFGSYLWLGRLMDVTTVLLFVTGIQLLAVGVLADMLSRKYR